MKNSYTRRQRRPLGHISSYNTNLLSLRNPWITAWWSMCFPGFGHLTLGIYIKGFILMAWEFLINLNTNINLGILYSFTGNFNKAIDVLNKRWLLLYLPVYVYTIWDSYRTTIDLNKLYVLSLRQDPLICPLKISPLSIVFLDKRIKWLSAFWSAVMPGTGQLYNQNIPSGFILLFVWIFTVYFSNILSSIHLLFMGDFYESIHILNMEWLLFLPSMYGYTIRDAYVSAEDINRVFEIEQIHFLKKYYQSPNFEMPV